MLLPRAAMLSVIGTYANEESATRAVRGLEPALSIQDMVVVDLDHIVWRKVRPSKGESFPKAAHFAVLMRGEAHEIDRARALLK